MHGLINKAIQGLVCTQMGEATWEQICQRAAVEEELFLANATYPDDITHRLIQAASEITGLTSDEIMQAFGRYWLLYTAQEGYGSMLKASGRTYYDFILNLPALHTRVGLVLPNLSTPTFWCTDVTPTSIRLHYRSARLGFAAVVLGVLSGLEQWFDTQVTVQHIVRRDQGADHDEFLLNFSPR
jgi:hypothetical protein